MRCVLSFTFFFFFFFLIQPQHLTKSSVNSAFVHCLWIHKFHFLAIFSLKMGLAILFTYLKIILLQCLQFQFSVSVTISSIQTDLSYSFHFCRASSLFWGWRGILIISSNILNHANYAYIIMKFFKNGVGMCSSAPSTL